MNGVRLSVGALLIFLVALGLFIYILTEDNKKTEKEERNFKDNTWIGIFGLILFTGIVISLTCCYKNYNIEDTNNCNSFGETQFKDTSPTFVGDKIF
jgi:hypothetical protein